MMIEIEYDGKKISVEKGKRVKEFIDEFLPNVDAKTIMACKINNEVKSLSASIDESIKLELIDYTRSDGSRIYIRGLIFILTKAFEELYPENKITVNYALGHSIYCEYVDGTKIPDEVIEKVKNKMLEIVDENLLFVKSELSIEDAKKMYMHSNRQDKIGILENRVKPYVSLYSCGNTVNYFYGVMPYSTGSLKYFELLPYENGLRLLYPRRSSPTVVAKVQNTKKLYATFDEYDKIHKALGVQNVVELNKWIRDGKEADLIRITEALHEKKIANIADMIAEDKGKKIVLIAGPSSSGKTTFAQRLAIQLRVNGITSVALSMDNYFVERKDNPKDENGNNDYECLEAIDVKLFNDQLTALLNGEEVKLPTFDFNDGSKKYLGNTAKLGENQVLIIEGIHGLNEALTASIPREKKFKIYISSLTALNIDDYNRISTSDTRLLRRIERDSLFRSHSPVATLKMWPSVRRGEEKYIFPFQEDADVIFNSSLVYEPAVMKVLLEPILANVSETEPEYSDAKRLYEFLSYFLPMKTDDIPINSLLREFIGGGCFYR